MPILENQRHELFAHGLAKGKTTDQAYRDAGYRPNRAGASRLAAKANIRERVEELQGDMVERVTVDRAWVLSKLQEVVRRALPEEGKMDGSAANKALELLGKELGMFIERRHVTGVIEQLHSMSDDQLDRLIGNLADDAGIAGILPAPSEGSASAGHEGAGTPTAH